MNRNDIFNAVIRRDAVLTKWLLRTERFASTVVVRQLNTSKEKLGQEYEQEVAGLKEKLKTTKEQLRAERQKERRSGLCAHSTYAAVLGARGRVL